MSVVSDLRDSMPNGRLPSNVVEMVVGLWLKSATAEVERPRPRSGELLLLVEEARWLFEDPEIKRRVANGVSHAGS